jgi:TolB-like protein
MNPMKPDRDRPQRQATHGARTFPRVSNPGAQAQRASPTEVPILERIRQRKMVQWSLAYLAGAWLLAQVFHLVGQQFDWPASVLRGLTVLLGFGLLPAMVVAWYHGEKGAQEVSRAELGILTLLLAFGGLLVYWTAQRASPHPQPPDPIEQARLDPLTLAILPFDLLGDAPADRHLADGLHSELLLNMARLSGLRVISRTSVSAYPPGQYRLRQVAEELRAGSVIEGSVQRIGEHLQVRLQLIDASTDTHRWVDSFRASEDQAFALKSRMALDVARALGVRPSAEEVAAISEPPSAHPTALAAYREALALWHDGRDPQTMASRFQEALDSDPGLYSAHGFLAAHTARNYAFSPPEARAGLRAAAEGHLDALRIHAADSPHRYLAEGTYRYYVDGDRENALLWLQRARRGFPNTATLLTYIGAIQYSGGRFEEALDSYREATMLDPRYPAAAINYIIRLKGIWRFDEAEAEAGRILRLRPDCDECRFWWMRTLYEWSGDPAYLEQGLDTLANPGLRASHALWAAVARRDVARALEIAAAPAPTYLESIWALPRDLHPAAIYMQAGASEQGGEVLLAALSRMREVQARLGHSPMADRLLAEILMVAGRCEEALAFMRERTPPLGTSRDINRQLVMAVIELRCAEVETARARMRHILDETEGPLSGVSPALMLSYPAMDALAADPVVRALIEAKRARLPVQPALTSG